MARLKMTKVVVSRFQLMEPFSPLAQNGMTETVLIAGTCACTP